MSVTMEDLYKFMKEALDSLGLRFHDMALVEVKCGDNYIEFTNPKSGITIRKHLD